MKRCFQKSEKGLTSLAVVGIMVVLALFGLAVARLVGVSHTMRSDHVLYETAVLVAEAGIEYGVRKIYEAQSPLVGEPGKNFGRGNFTISQSGRTLTVTGRVGEVSVVRQVDSPTMADCTTIDVSSVNLTGDDRKINGIQFRKVCLVQSVIDRMTFTWTPNNPSERLFKIKIENTTVYNNPAVPSGTEVDISNYVMNNDNQNNINPAEFNSEMEDKSFSLVFTYTDGSSEQVAFATED